MTLVSSAVLVGSVESMPARTVTIYGSPVTVAAGDYYLRDATGARSLLTAFTAAMTAAGLASTTAVVRRNGKIRIAASGTFAVVWTDTVLRDLLGFTGNLSLANNYTAPNVSPLLWLPGWPETSETPIGTAGHKIHDTKIVRSASGKYMSFATHHVRVENRLSWDAVPISRVWTAAEAGGEFRRFYDDVLVAGQRFKLYSGATQEIDLADSSTDMTWTTPLGPYKLAKVDGRWYERGIKNTDLVSPVEFDVGQVEEFA